VRRKDLDYDMIRRVLGQWKQYAPYYFGDYYPLTAYSLDETAWMAWQFDVPEKGEGVVQAFRRAASVYEVARLKLRGLDGGAEYVFTNLDTGLSQTLAGRELLDRGVWRRGIGDDAIRTMSRTGGELGEHQAAASILDPRDVFT
jgi:alpha-galactosidase